MNPFSYGTVVKGEYFYDRKDELERIVKTLGGGNNVVMFAPRRFGKTSLVFRAIEELEKMNYECVYFDFMPIYSKESFIEAYSKAILSKQNSIQTAVKKISKLVLGIRPKLTFNKEGSPEFSLEFTEDKINERTLGDILDLPEKISTSNKRFIVILDEFQEINKLNGDNFEKLFRSKIQLQKKVNYLFLGSRTHLLNDMFNNKGKAFYNAAMIMQIGAMPKQETIDFLKKRFAASKIIIDEPVAEYLIEQAGNIPYYIQLLAAEVWQYLLPKPGKVSMDVISVCSERIIDLKSDYYLELFDKQTAYQKKVLKSLVIRGESIYSAEYAKRFRLSAVSTTQKAISGLIETGIVEKIKNKYYISDPFFNRFLKRIN